MTLELEIEEVTKSDREEIESLSEGIWDGWDYVPDVFGEWIEDGGFICGRKNGEIVALAKHTWQKEGVLWLEGLRVHPDNQGEGYGREMIEAQIEVVEQLDYDVIRFLTSGDKTPVRKVAEDLNFELKKSFDYLRLDEDELEEMEPPAEEEYERVKAEDRGEEVADFVLSSSEFDNYEELYVEGWTAYDLEKELIIDRLERGKCYSVREDDDLKGVMFKHLNETYDSVSVPFITGEIEVMEELLNFCLNEVLNNDRRTFRLKTGLDRVVDAAEEVGLKWSDHGSSVVYEKKAEDD